MTRKLFVMSCRQEQREPVNHDRAERVSGVSHVQRGWRTEHCRIPNRASKLEPYSSMNLRFVHTSFGSI